MKSKIFVVISTLINLVLATVVAVLVKKNCELKKELKECAPYKIFFTAFGGRVTSVAPIKFEDSNPLFFESTVDGKVSSSEVYQGSELLKDGGQIYILGRAMFIRGNSGKSFFVLKSQDLFTRPHIFNPSSPVPVNEYIVKFGLYGITNDFSKLSANENGWRFTFTDNSKKRVNVSKVSETLQKFLTAIQLPDYLKQVYADLAKLEYRAKALAAVTEEFNSGTKGLDSVLQAELRLLDVLMKGVDLPARMKQQLIKEYLKRLEKLCSLKEAEFKMGATPLSELREHQEALYDFKRAHNIK